MDTIEIVTYHGCEAAEALSKKLNELQKSENFRLVITTVSTLEQAVKNRLNGSPTIFLNDKEYQKDHRSLPGFYCRRYMVADEYHTVPPVEDLIDVMKGRTAYGVWSGGEQGLHYPVLLVSQSCAMCFPAKNYWSKVADEMGVNLRVIVVEKNEELSRQYNASGYPCLVAGPDRYHYGIHRSHEEARKLLQRFSV